MAYGKVSEIVRLSSFCCVGVQIDTCSDNFDHYWRVASKVTPAVGIIPHSLVPSTTISLHNRPPSADPGGPLERDGAYNVRSVPVRIYLPDGPVLQDLVPPILEDGYSSSSHDCHSFIHLDYRFPKYACAISYSPYTTSLPVKVSTTYSHCWGSKCERVIYA